MSCMPSTAFPILLAGWVLEVEPSVFTLMQCTPLLVEKVGVAPVRFTVHHLSFETNGEGHTKWPHKMCPTKI